MIPINPLTLSIGVACSLFFAFFLIEQSINSTKKTIDQPVLRVIVDKKTGCEYLIENDKVFVQKDCPK